MTIDEVMAYVAAVPDLIASFAKVESDIKTKPVADAHLMGRIEELEVQLNREQMHRRFADDMVVKYRADLDFAKRISPEVLKAFTSED
jgi:hypothetical protein